MSIVRGFSIIGNTLKNQAYAQHIRRAIAEVEKGKSIASILGEKEKLFPATVVEMISVAEQSGALDDMTLQLAEHYEEEVSATLDGLSVIIEPILMLILGVAIGTIAIAVLWPMYNLVNVI
jgi:type IV pilus assembly protein PilC